MSERQNNQSLLAQYVEAFLDYLRRPKTVFDLKDRTKALIILVFIIILLQKVVEFFLD
ncbi:MAG: hypothetical protein Q4D21_00885 [Phascolarctobacterium sp.]|nr:hypothetical protein [Phascolarctobacterium sp.]